MELKIKEQSAPDLGRLVEQIISWGLYAIRTIFLPWVKSFGAVCVLLYIIYYVIWCGYFLPLGFLTLLLMVLIAYLYKIFGPKGSKMALGSLKFII